MNTEYQTLIDIKKRKKGVVAWTPIIIHCQAITIIYPKKTPGMRSIILIIFLFNSLISIAQPDTTNNRYATVTDASYWPSVNTGDYIFFSLFFSAAASSFSTLFFENSRIAFHSDCSSFLLIFIL